MKVKDNEEREIANKEPINLNEFNCIIDDQTGKILNLPFCNYERGFTLIRCTLYAKKADKILLGTNEGLYICNSTTFKMENVLDPASTDGWFYNRIDCTDSFFLFERKDGTILTSAKGGTIKIYDLFKLQTIKEIILEDNGRHIYDGTELTNGNLVFAYDMYIYIYDGETFEQINKINASESSIYVVCSINNNKFMTSSYDKPGLIFWKNEENLITKEFRFNGIEITSRKKIIFDSEKNVIIIGLDTNILIIDGKKYNVIKNIIVGEGKFLYVTDLFLLERGSFIASNSEGKIFEYNGEYNLESQLNNYTNDYFQLRSESVDNIVLCNKCLMVTYRKHSIKVFKKSNEKKRESKYYRSDYDSD